MSSCSPIEGPNHRELVRGGWHGRSTFLWYHEGQVKSDFDHPTPGVSLTNRSRSAPTFHSTQWAGSTPGLVVEDGGGDECGEDVAGDDQCADAGDQPGRQPGNVAEVVAGGRDRLQVPLPVWPTASPSSGQFPQLRQRKPRPSTGSRLSVAKRRLMLVM